MGTNNDPDQTTLASWFSTIDLACALLALALGLAIGWLDLHTTEVAVTILALIVVGLLLGLLRPAAAWRWAVLLSIGLPIMAALVIGIGMQTAEPAKLDVRIALVAFVFAFVGSYAGVWVRQSLRILAGRSH